MKRKKKQSFSEILKSTMDRQKISVRKLSELTAKEGHKIPASTISSWRNGAVGSDFHALKVIARCLGVSLSYLLTGESEDSLTHELGPDEFFDEGEVYYEGFAKVRIQSLTPRKIKTKK